MPWPASPNTSGRCRISTSCNQQQAVAKPSSVKQRANSTPHEQASASRRKQAAHTPRRVSGGGCRQRSGRRHIQQRDSQPAIGSDLFVCFLLLPSPFRLSLFSFLTFWPQPRSALFHALAAAGRGRRANPRRTARSSWCQRPAGRPGRRHTRPGVLSAGCRVVRSPPSRSPTSPSTVLPCDARKPALSGRPSDSCSCMPACLPTCLPACLPACLPDRSLPNPSLYAPRLCAPSVFSVSLALVCSSEQGDGRLGDRIGEAGRRAGRRAWDYTSTPHSTPQRRQRADGGRMASTQLHASGMMVALPSPPPCSFSHPFAAPLVPGRESFHTCSIAAASSAKWLAHRSTCSQTATAPAVYLALLGLSCMELRNALTPAERGGPRAWQ